MNRRNFSISSLLVVSLLLLALVQLSGCGGGGANSASTGILKVAITDRPSDDYGKVVVAIREVRVVPAGKDSAADDDPGLPVVAHFDAPKVVDIMKLQFIQQALGEVALPAGSYSQIRLILEPNPNGQQPPVNYLTLKSDPSTLIPLTTPGAVQTGLKISGPLVVKPGVINAVTIDFDPNTAVVPRGNGSDFNFKPHGIRLVQTAGELSQYGSIAGTVTSSSKAWSNATVSIKRRGAVNDSDPIAAGTIFASYTSNRWEAPFAAFVPPSTATVSYKAFVAADGFRVYSSAAVPVYQSAATNLEVISLTPVP